MPAVLNAEPEEEKGEEYSNSKSAWHSQASKNRNGKALYAEVNHENQAVLPLSHWRRLWAELVMSWRPWDILEGMREVWIGIEALSLTTWPQVRHLAYLIWGMSTKISPHPATDVWCYSISSKCSLPLRISTLFSPGWIRRPRKSHFNNMPRTLSEWLAKPGLQLNSKACDLIMIPFYLAKIHHGNWEPQAGLQWNQA